MTAFTFPRPGERRNSSAVPVPEAQLARLLVLASYGLTVLIELDSDYDQDDQDTKLIGLVLGLLPEPLGQRTADECHAAVIEFDVGSR